MSNYNFKLAYSAKPKAKLIKTVGADITYNFV
jgi:hypothetical protein